jgi:hypothetical protein
MRAIWVALRLMPRALPDRARLLLRLFLRPDAWEKAFNAVKSPFETVVSLRIPVIAFRRLVEMRRAGVRAVATKGISP